MFLHLGSDISVKTKNIIAIMDLETSSVSKITKEFLKKVTTTNYKLHNNKEIYMKTYFEIKLGKKTYSCCLRREKCSTIDRSNYILSCDDEHGNEVGYSTSLDEDTFKIIKLMLYSESTEITGTDFDEDN